MFEFTDEQNELRAICKQFAEQELGPYAAKFDKEESFNLKAFKKLGELGILGITADPEYGGAGLGAVAATLAMEEIGRVCASTALSYLAHSILCVNNLDKNGSKEQKQKYLPRLISGEDIGCMGMSEPEYGSDAIGMQTRAEKKGKKYFLNGSKIWITNAQYSDICYVYARTGKNKRNLSTFIVEKNFPGFSCGSDIHKLGMKASPTGELIFENCEVPVENRIGEEGDSLTHMLVNLEIERITICGISLGIAKASLEQSVKYAGERKQFGKTIGNFQLIQKMLAEMSAQVSMMESFLYTVAKAYDQNTHPSKSKKHNNKGRLLAAEVKLVIPQIATKIALDAIQIHGGYGYSQEFPLERYLRDAKLMEIGAGTNEVMITIIAKQLLGLKESL
jgi:isovaleryl-CoA dehydrogenase